MTSTDVTNTGTLELSEDACGDVDARRSPRCARSACRFALSGQYKHLLGDLVAGAADRRPHGGPQIRWIHSTTSEGVDGGGDDAVEHASPPGVHGSRQSTVPGREQNGNAVGHENAAACGRPNRSGVQDESIRRGHFIDPSRGDDSGVDLVHPGQVTPLLKSEQLLELTTMTLNTLRVVPDVERQVPSVIGGPSPGVSNPILSGATWERDGKGPQTAGSEVPTSPRAQIHLDQVRGLNGTGVAHGCRIPGQR